MRSIGRSQGTVRALRLWPVVVVLAVAASPLIAQPTAVYELDDFLDPALLGTTVASDGSVQPGNRFLVAELLAGTISDFEHLGGYTDGTIEFAHFATNFYLGLNQINLLATEFDPLDSSATPSANARGDRCDGDDPVCKLPLERARFVPDYRLRLQYGRYSFNQSSQQPHLDRWVVSAGYEKGPFGDIYDLGFVLDLPDEENFIGSLGYDWRIVEDGFDQHRVLFFYTWPNEHWKRLSAPFRFSLGGERTEGHWRWAPVRLEASLRYEIRPLRTTLHITYAPSYRPASRGFDSGVNHELAAFIDVVAVAKVFAPAQRRAGR